MLTSNSKHVLHCVLFISVIIYFELLSGAIKLNTSDAIAIEPVLHYGYIGTFVLYILRLLVLLAFPQALFNFFGLVFYNAFPEKVKLKGSPLLAPFLCIRVVTRGDFPDLVRSNVATNLKKCTEAGLENFIIEVVTDKPINLSKHGRVKEIVVPNNYKTSSGALYKSRALQYCLEDDISVVNDNDWIVHLDEETLLTENCIHGILNFIIDGKYQFGQGLITYANENVVNWLTTLADSFRVADDMGKMRFQLLAFNKPLFGWKGSYVVTKVAAEKDVSFDNGLDGSVAEDCYFAIKALKLGYSFSFIEGEMWEKSPFTLYDFMQQRKRWLQGIYLVCRSKEFNLYHKFFLQLSFYSWATLPLGTSNIILSQLFPIPMPFIIDFFCAFVAAVNIYSYIFGVMKSFSLIRMGYIKLILCVFMTLGTIPLNMIIENMAVIWGLVSNKHKFYIVNKDLKLPMDV